MTPHTPTRITPHLALGLCIMALGVLLILDRLGIVPAAQSLQFWPVALILFGASLAYQAFRGGPAEGDTLSGRGRHRSPLGLLIILILVAVAFAHSQRSDRTTTGSADRPSLFAIMGADRRTSLATNFRGAEMTSIMGGTRLDLRSATIEPGQHAVIDVFALMGGAVVRVPQGWTVDVQVTQVMGGVSDQRSRGMASSAGSSGMRRRRDRGWDWDDDLDDNPPPAPVPPTAPATGATTQDDTAGQSPHITIRGFVMWGGVNIRN